MCTFDKLRCSKEFSQFYYIVADRNTLHSGESNHKGLSVRQFPAGNRTNFKFERPVSSMVCDARSTVKSNFYIVADRNQRIHLDFEFRSKCLHSDRAICRHVEEVGIIHR